MKVRIRPHNPYYQHSDAEWTLHLERVARRKKFMKWFADAFSRFIESVPPTCTTVDEMREHLYTYDRLGGSR